MELVQGTRIRERYRLVRILGEGGMGVVWAALDETSGQTLALKFLKRKEEDHKKRFFREARIASALAHPNIIDVFDLFELEDGTAAMVMALLEGESLADRLVRVGKLPLGELATILLGVASAVGAAHARGVVHRDLKPENIFLRGPASEVKVLDFGIAKLTAAEGAVAQTAGLTHTGAIMGTPYYMAPEQVYGEKTIDHLVDVWALGIIIYESLSGVRPVDGDNFGQLFKAITMGDIPKLVTRAPEIPEVISDLVARMLARDKRARPSSLAEVCTTFAPFAGGGFRPFDAPVAFTPSAPPPPSLRAANATPEGLAMAATEMAFELPAPKRRWPFIAAATVALALVAGGAFSARTILRRAHTDAAPPAPSTALAAADTKSVPAPTSTESPATSATSAPPPPSAAVPALSSAPHASTRARTSPAPRATAAKLPAGIHGESPY